MSYHKAKPLHLQHPSLSSQAVFIQHMKVEKDKRKTSQYRRGNMEPYARTNPEADKHEEAQQQPQLSAAATTHSSRLSFPHQ
jgi:hypothetical protein